MEPQITTVAEISDFEGESAIDADFMLDFSGGRPKTVIVIARGTVSDQIDLGRRNPGFPDRIFGRFDAHLARILIYAGDWLLRNPYFVDKNRRRNVAELCHVPTGHYLIRNIITNRLDTHGLHSSLRIEGPGPAFTKLE